MVEYPLLLVALALIFGALIGAVFMRYWSPRLRANEKLERKLQRAEQELNDYRDEVTKHFTETSKLVNNLTQSYRDVHEHLANSAMKLTTPTISRQFTRQLEQASPDSLPGADTNSGTDIQVEEQRQSLEDDEEQPTAARAQSVVETESR